MWHGRAMSEQMIFVPPEWAPQRALWVGWPHLLEEWGDAFISAQVEIAAFVRAAAAYVPVRVACGSAMARQRAGLALAGIENVYLEDVPAGDIWLRDTGPIVGRSGKSLLGLTFGFNGWGGKFVMPGDTETAAAICGQERLAVQAHDFILEGGAIDLDGAGRLLTTRECVLNTNRNGWTQDQAEAALKAALCVSEIIWLDEGLVEDHTDGHVDNIARFAAPGHVVCQTPSGTDDPQEERLATAEAALHAAGLRVTTMPSPGRVVGAEGEMMPASHMNFTLVNGAVLLPVYEDTYSAQAADVLRELFPDRDVVCLPALHILSGGGSFHCMTREIPDLGAMT
jgi:agmatine deiminase